MTQNKVYSLVLTNNVASKCERVKFYNSTVSFHSPMNDIFQWSIRVRSHFNQSKISIEIHCLKEYGHCSHSFTFRRVDGKDAVVSYLLKCFRRENDSYRKLVCRLFFFEIVWTYLKCLEIAKLDSIRCTMKYIFQLFRFDDPKEKTQMLREW